MTAPSTANGNGDASGKTPVHASMSEVSRRYNIDGLDDDDGYDETDSRRRGHTRKDQKDMRRMGKRQELIVSSRAISARKRIEEAFLTIAPEKLSPALRAEFRGGAASHLGIPLDVRFCRTTAASANRRLTVPWGSSNTQGLTDGGLAGLFWTYLWTFIGFGFVMFSLGEMASM